MMYLGIDSHYRKKTVCSMITQLINNMYETQEWAKDFIEVITIAFKGEAKSDNMQQTSRSQLITHTAKRVARILRKVLKGNSRMYLEKISLDL